MGEGCFAQGGRVAMQVDRLSKDSTPLQAAKAEAQAILASFQGGEVPRDGFKGRGRDLRLHVSGDCRTASAAATLGSAAKDWRARGGGNVWTYTHAWRKVPRFAWTPHVSVLASIEDSKDGLKAIREGYAPALIVARHTSAKAEVKDGIRWIPCPAQTTEDTPNPRSCIECRLCFDGDALRKRRAGITFAAHGVSKKRILRVIQGGDNV